MAQSKEVVFDLNDPAFANDEFRMYEFKVKRCPRARPHDWTMCPFAHPGEKAKRRDPSMGYSGTACPDYKKNGNCPRKDNCPFAHGVFECWLHPAKYRTQPCTDNPNCKRAVCFFAHSDAELRRSDKDARLKAAQQHSDMVASEALLVQQQQQLQALQMMMSKAGLFSAQGSNNPLEMIKSLPQLSGNSSELFSKAQLQHALSGPQLCSAAADDAVAQQLARTQAQVAFQERLLAQLAQHIHQHQLASSQQHAHPSLLQDSLGGGLLGYGSGLGSGLLSGLGGMHHQPSSGGMDYQRRAASLDFGGGNNYSRHGQHNPFEMDMPQPRRSYDGACDAARLSALVAGGDSAAFFGQLGQERAGSGSDGGSPRGSHRSSGGTPSPPMTPSNTDSLFAGFGRQSSGSHHLQLGSPMFSSDSHRSRHSFDGRLPVDRASLGSGSAADPGSYPGSSRTSGSSFYEPSTNAAEAIAMDTALEAVLNQMSLAGAQAQEQALGAAGLAWGQPAAAGGGRPPVRRSVDNGVISRYGSGYSRFSGEQPRAAPMSVFQEEPNPYSSAFAYAPARASQDYRNVSAAPTNQGFTTPAAAQVFAASQLLISEPMDRQASLSPPPGRQVSPAQRGASGVPPRAPAYHLHATATEQDYGTNPGDQGEAMKRLLEGFSLLNSSGAATRGMARNDSFGMILSELPRSYSEVHLPEVATGRLGASYNFA